LYASQAENELSILKYIERRIEAHYQCAPPQGAVESALLSGQALVIFDGLDELVDTYQRREVTNRVELFASRYPLVRILVTSRKIGYSQAQLDEAIFWDYEISGFQHSQIESYVSQWFRHIELLEQEESQRIGRAFITESEVVPDLRTNPLMLSLL